MTDTLEDGYDKLPELKYDSMSIKELIGEARRTAPAMTAHDESFERLKEVIETRKKEHLLKATKENDDTMDIMGPFNVPHHDQRAARTLSTTAGLRVEEICEFWGGWGRRLKILDNFVF
ncbi:hypothetical protein CAEBREN_00972 [Caenorhabditis brenneri]|uniref:Uncharacterized protein n=1 Tax=Caenorhabditis brenneri TaxID=135651 RepID=G0MBN9_CAEBE|nr:hypothetical protein CAEBREN_00972 [Caenorhabditis brenneri]